MSELVNLYVETEDGWKLVFKDIPEDIAIEIWRAGLKTEEHKFSIEWKDDKDFFQRQINSLYNR